MAVAVVVIVVVVIVVVVIVVGGRLRLGAGRTARSGFVEEVAAIRYPRTTSRVGWGTT